MAGATVEVRQDAPLTAPAGGEPVWVEPDLGFIRDLGLQAGPTFKKCFQCGTCSATCELTPETEPFPRKEMAWAVWGLRDRLLRDVDVWLCHQCNDCSTRCPRGGRPGDVLAAVRRECVMRYSFPRGIARAVGEPVLIPLLLGIPAALLALALLARKPLGEALGLERSVDDRIVFSYSNMLPQWLINLLFGLVAVLVVLVTIVGVVRFWRALRSGVPPGRLARPARGRLASLGSTLASVLTHRDFRRCGAARPRYPAHLLVFLGFVALTLVTIWVITARHNPLIADGFVYPFGFWDPWKVLANLGGLAVLAGGLLMVRDRLRSRDEAGSSTYFDWSLLALILLVAATGLLTEVLHYTRYEPHRHGAYFIHLVLVMALFLYLPYSKLAHLAYRTAALVFAERIGRVREPSPDGGAGGPAPGYRAGESSAVPCAPETASAGTEGGGT